MATGRRKNEVAFGLSSHWLVLAALVLVAAGIAGGVVLDLYLHPIAGDVREVERRPKPAQRPTPVLQNAPTEDTPSLYTRRTGDTPPVKAAEPSDEAPKAPPEKPIAVPAEKPAAKPAPKPGATPAAVFAVPADIPRNRPVLAIVIDDMGLDRARSQRAIALPAAVTLSLMTYAPDLQALAKQARAGGHELLAHVPMEPINKKESPGPGALTVAMNEAEIHAALAASLDAWQGYVGINNHMGSRFTADRVRMNAVMSELKGRGLIWLDSKTTGNSAGIAAAKEAGVPFVERDVFLDNVQTAAAVGDEIEHAIAAAKSRGSAVAIGHPHEVTLVALTEMLRNLEGRGVSLAPISEVLKRRQAQVAQD